MAGRNLIFLLTIVAVSGGLIEDTLDTLPKVVDTVCKVAEEVVGSFSYQVADKYHASVTGIGTVEIDTAPEKKNKLCDKSTWTVRTYDGTCNHKENKGAANTPVGRSMPPHPSAYSNEPRRFGKNGLPLPSPRLLSARYLTKEDRPETNTMMTWAFGQFLDHDFTLTAVSVLKATTKCCGENGTRPPIITDSNCFPIEVPKDDPDFKTECMEFVRSLPVQNSKNHVSIPRNQINTLTSFIDCSNIYGPSDAIAERLRVPGSYLLKSKIYNGGVFPPVAATGCRKRQGSGDFCFDTGDSRSNQQPYLQYLQTIWLRLHNILATEIKRERSDLPNEEIFQYARRYVIAIFQHIVYNEYLPTILGDFTKEYSLDSMNGRSTYNSKIDPSLATEFATAGFRAHTQVNSWIDVNDSLPLLADTFGNVGFILDNIKGVAIGITGQSGFSQALSCTQKRDRHIDDQLSVHLFAPSSKATGQDLSSFNIQRGRDHNLGTYNDAREACNLAPLTDFNSEELGEGSSELSKFYSDPADIDLIVGINAEKSIGNSLFGPVGTCIVAKQFQRSKNGDRFFFTHPEKQNCISNEQLAAIRRLSNGHVICLTTGIEEVQKDTMKFSSATNPKRKCIDLNNDWNYKVFAKSSRC